MLSHFASIIYTTLIFLSSLIRTRLLFAEPDYIMNEVLLVVGESSSSDFVRDSLYRRYLVHRTVSEPQGHRGLSGAPSYETRLEISSSLYREANTHPRAHLCLPLYEIDVISAIW